MILKNNVILNRTLKITRFFGKNRDFEKIGDF